MSAVLTGDLSAEQVVDNNNNHKEIEKIEIGYLLCHAIDKSVIWSGKEFNRIMYYFQQIVKYLLLRILFGDIFFRNDDTDILSVDIGSKQSIHGKKRGSIIL